MVQPGPGILEVRTKFGGTALARLECVIDRDVEGEGHSEDSHGVEHEPGDDPWTRRIIPPDDESGGRQDERSAEGKES